MWIPESALPRFCGKRVRLFIDGDKAGRTGAKKWFHQLHQIAADIDGYEFSGLVQTDKQPVKDLDDLCRVDYDSWEQNRCAIQSLMDFAMSR